MKKEKKADLTMSWLVVIILIIAGFVILLLLYVYFPWKGTIDRETCHQSVIFKATTPNILAKKALNLPLRCKTEKICISTKSNGECIEFGSEEHKTEKVSSNTKEQQEKIKEIIAQELYNCWWMMGEGKVQVFTRQGSAGSYTQRCVICSRIAFSSELKEKDGKVNVIKYLKETKVPGAEYSYLDFLYKGEYLSKSGGVFYQAVWGGFRDFEYKQQYAIIFKEFDRTTAPEEFGAFLGAVVGTIIGAKIPVLIKQIPIFTFAGGYFGFEGADALAGMLLGDKYVSTWAIVPYDLDELGETNCDTFENIP